MAFQRDPTPSDLDLCAELQYCTANTQTQSRLRYFDSSTQPALYIPLDHIMATQGPRLQGLINSEAIQAVLPNLPTPPSPSQCRQFTWGVYDARRVQYTLHSIADELYNHMKLSELWRHSCRDGHNDLLWFLHRVNLEKPTSPASSVRTAAQRNVSGSRSDEEPAFPDLHTISPEKGRFRRRVTPTRFGDLTDFEDLFYMIWHKVLTLYHDLQLRYACGFLTLQSVIHNRSITLRENKPLTVREFAWYLQLVWQELTDPELIASMDRSLRSRIITKDLLPGYDPDNHTEEDGLRIRMAYQNRAFTRMPHAPGLKDVSRASPIDIINQVYKKHGIILDCEKEIEASDNSARAMRRAGIKYIQKRTEERVTGLSPDDPRNFPCTCSRQCPCKDLCIVEPDGGCLCKMRPEFYSSYEGDMAAADSLEHEYGATIGEHSLWGAGSNEEAQLQVATAALSRDPEHSTLMIKSARDAQNLARKLEWEYVRETMKTPTHGSPMSLDKPLPDLPPEPMTPCPPSRKRLAGSIKSHVKRFKVARKPVGYEGGYSCY